ncbi:methyltransferase domain-containing protein [Mesorhizobium sp.]|uniref:class I SAM-dependent methyltransferase n=1 Tax=Mesorhizobium sp. TaxID=1871066 RepID=UPI000FE7D8A8|nr:methyltransferase domain-containing protein [Mesorhizobium sp.]RWI72230.1 MAG: methyltransferase domain-containing protein [Mesorhizobium sp.]
MNLPSYAMNQASFPQMYERWLVGPLFRPWAEMTVEEVGLAPHDRVLDIACGTGILARVAKERIGAAGHVVGIDISPDMLSVARSVASGIEWREGSASALPLKNGEQFDVVACQQGLQFFPDKPAAATQMRRALAKGGRLAVATWRSDEEIPYFRELRRVAERHLGAISDQRYGFGDAAPLETLLRDAGFNEVRSKVLSRTIRFEDGAPFLRLNTMALVGMSAAGKTMSDQERKEIVEEIVSDSVSVQQSYSNGSALAFELRTNLATATG